MAEFVAARIKPLLRSRCFDCHSAQAGEPKGGLRLDSREWILKGGESGPVVEPGNPEKSALIAAINYRGDFEMPPKSKMPEGEIALLTRWVEMGAPWPAGDPPAAKVDDKPFPLAERKAAHWAWQPVANPPVPAVKQTTWPRHDLDRFVLVKLEAAGLKPAPAADRNTLLRRVWFDVVGLPPPPQDVAAFVRDSAPTDQALDNVVDRLLASPHFGERWARHWLDLMRYAESRGHEFDFSTPNAWQYRDYVIRAFNADLPYSELIVEHVAGDLIETPRLHPTRGFNESILGTGFWYLGDWVHSPVDVRRDETDRIDNMLDTLSRSVLGLTIACARCHDHKFDAISTRDYYALAGFVRSSSYRQVPFETLEHNRRVAQELWDVRARHAARLRKRLADALRPAIVQTADYLLAAIGVRLGAETPQAAASARRLHRPRLEAWIAALEAAPGDPASPLGLVVRALEAKPNGEVALASLLEPGSKTWRSRLVQGGARIVVDYSQPGPDGWIQDGFAFGPGPVLPGGIRWSDDPRRPASGVELFGAARHDAAWRGLSISRDSQYEAGILGHVSRSGQMLRTPTFTIGSGVLHYLARGQATLTAIVGEHRMIRQPLHAELVKSLDTGGNLRWVSHSLNRFRGLRAHIEFAPVGGPFDLLMIAEAEQTPPGPEIAVAPLLRAKLGRVESVNTRQLADAIEELLASTLERLSSERIPRGPLMEEEAALADWIVRSHDLFGGDDAAIAGLAGQVKGLRDEELRLGAQIQKVSHTAIAILDGPGEDEQLLIRGNSKTPAGPVPRRFLEALVGPHATSYPRGSGRLELARQIVDPKVDPFVSRVIVNRVWHHLFGRGIVPSVDNFGVLGQKPSHPELLDHLATRFVAEGWSLKKLIRHLLTSRTYQMSSQPADAATENADPDNILLHRANLRRLDGEAIRDAMLMVSGRLDPKLEGPPVPVYLTPFMTGRGRPPEGPLDGAGRRSIYTSVRRNFLSPMMLAFDMPVPTVPVGRRNVSNVPAQPLILLNDPFVLQQASVWATNVLAVADATPETRIRQMYEAALGREPSVEEIACGTTFLKEQAAALEITGEGWQREPRVWADFGHVLWNVKEFIFLD